MSRSLLQRQNDKSESGGRMNPYPAGSEMAAIWQLGHDEAGGDVGMTYDDDPGSPRSVAYDEGRNAGAAAGTPNEEEAVDAA
jgi:hypothetical protein